MSNNSSHKIDTPDFSIELKDGGYYYIVINDQVYFTPGHLKQIVEAQRQVGAKKLPVLVITKDGVDTDLDVLKELARDDNQPYSLAVAYVLTSLPQKILSKLYIKIIKPIIPTKFFNDEQEAFKWLKDNSLKSN